MTERLTIQEVIEHCEKTVGDFARMFRYICDDGLSGVVESKTYWEHKQTAEWLKELQHYKDLEEQGRLHIVPKEFWDMNMEYLIKDVCPFDYGLVGLNEADCKADDVRCKECWEKALKGE